MSNVAYTTGSEVSMNTVNTELTVGCGTTQIAIAGGFWLDANPGVEPAILASYPVSPSEGVFGWSVIAAASTQTYTLHVYVVCANVQTTPEPPPGPTGPGPF
jgi:hypothetical protein